MSYRIKEAFIEDGFETRLVYQVTDSDGVVISTCDSKADAIVEIRDLDPKVDKRFYERQVDTFKRQHRSDRKETTWGDGLSTNKPSDIDRERYKVKGGPNYTEWLETQGTADGFHDPLESYEAKPENMAEEDSLSDWGADPEQLAETQEKRQALDSKIKEAEKSLSDKQKKVWELHGRMNIPFSDIAQILKISEGAAKTHFNRAKAKLREQLK